MRTVLLAVLMLITPAPASALDNARWGDVPDHVRSWFKSVRSPNGVPCCDIADGHRTDYDIRAGGYWIPNPGGDAGEWMQVPPEAVVYNAGNPIGEAIVWYVLQGTGSDGKAAIYIRCFVPGGGA